VRRLGEFDSADEALSALVSAEQRERYVHALTSLHRSDLLRGR
jgi:hypothetical protein